MKSISATIIGALMAVVLLAVPVHADVNDFTISNYDISYTLGRDQEKRSVLETTERITAQFPVHDQNRGIERYIPRSYDGHDTSLEIISVADESQNQLEYTTYSSGEYTVVRIGNANRYVHGEQTYVLTYTQRDVTKSFSDTKSDEFYWDTNGTEWRVPIGRLSVSLTVDESLAGSLTGEHSCYVGRYNATDNCELIEAGTTYSALAQDLARGDNITLAIGFEPQTFEVYETPLIMKLIAVWFVVQGILIVVSAGLIVWLIVRYVSWSKRKKEVGTIIPEYIPPSDSSVSLSATLIMTHASFAAQLIDFAVRHYIKIYEVQESKLFSAAVYEMEIVKPIDDLRSEEREFLEDVFKSTQVGSRISTESLKKDYSLSTRLLDNPGKIQSLKRTSYGIQQKSPEKSAWFKRFGVTTLILSIALLSPPLFVVSMTAFILGVTLWVLTDKGLAMYRYLQGLKMYISVAEEERLKMLQSPEGAEKTQVDTADPKKLVRLYERVLPYAVLFGQEKEWNKQLGSHYQSTGQQPDWYSGANMAAFSSASFSSAMQSLTTTVNSSGASYSSSGGSSGGGFSGGGGGGGGGGGW
ncbi:hypothetical protein B7Z17_01380 [Candidatus Saccharibacteria bacterium 32-49-10]|nr:MAG: hypothetical protein B7Z17_01380 [Candidatus Saccharibacteria bacterium 32-49-10]